MKTKIMAIVSTAVFVFSGVAIVFNQTASADQYDIKIKALQKQKESFNNQAATLAEKAKTLKATIETLEAQASAMQTQIDISQVKYDQLVEKINETQQLIQANSEQLGIIIADSYVADRVSPIEMLASSKNLSDFLDKQEQRSAVQNQLTAKIKENKELKAQLEDQKTQAGRILEDQKNQKAQLDATRQEEQRILNVTKGQEASFQDMVKKNDAEITRLRAEQAAVNATRAQQYGGNFKSLPGDGSKGGYPAKWANAPIDAYVDDWGMYTRECVSYAAFKVASTYGNMPYWGGRGNANQWDDNARAMGIPGGTTPKPGSVGVSNAGIYGHVAWVESVNADGTINISHYNINWNGDYAEWYNLRASYFDYYIYFGEW